ncbi:hypothetical protein GCM10009554_35650 [Kribbella koreensis]|uniref:Zinc ribbon domain-containing protein n=1 Tax=Kribbella koreensis TaxID=57909 RepID=A0ABN1QHG4_9ACTN
MSEHCTTCGSSRTEKAHFCSRCEAGFEESRPTRRTEAPPGHDASWFVGVTMILAVIVVLGIVVANAMTGNALASRRPTGDQDLSGGYVVTQAPIYTQEPVYPTETWSPPDETTEPPPDPTPTPEPALGNELVSVSGEAAQDPNASAVVELLTTYFTAINNHDYVTYQAQQTRAAQKLLTSSEFATGFRSTVNSAVTLQSLNPTTDGRLLAELTFTSNQNAIDGPQGQTCTQWTVGKYLSGQPPTLLIDKAPKGYKATHQPC